MILLQGKAKTNVDKTMDGKKVAAGNYLLSVVSEGKNASILLTTSRISPEYNLRRRRGPESLMTGRGDGFLQQLDLDPPSSVTTDRS